MAIAVRSSLASTNGNGGANIVMDLPAGVQDNDVLIMMITARGGTGTTITTPSGWTLLQTALNSGTVLKEAIYWKLAASEPASYTVSLTNSKATGGIIALSGASKTAPIAAQFSGQVNGSSATVTAPALGTFPPNNGIDIFLGGNANGQGAGAPTNYTLAAEAVNGAGNTNTRTTSGISYRSLSNVTTVGTISATYGGAAVSIGYHIFIFEARTGNITTASSTQGTISPIISRSGALTTGSTTQATGKGLITISISASTNSNTTTSGNLVSARTEHILGTITTNSSLSTPIPKAIQRRTGAVNTSTILTASIITEGVIKYWTGTAWIFGSLKYWTGSVWSSAATLKRWNGSTWI